MIARYDTRTDTWDNPLAHEFAKNGELHCIAKDGDVEIWSSEIAEEITRVCDQVIKAAITGDKRHPHKFVGPKFSQEVLRSEKYGVAVGVYKWLRS